MPAIFLPRSVLDSFAVDSVAQRAKLVSENVNASPPPPEPAPPTPPPFQPPAPSAALTNPMPAPPTPEPAAPPTPPGDDSLTSPIPVAPAQPDLPPPPPALQDFQASAGLGPTPSAAPPPLADFRASAGLPPVSMFDHVDLRAEALNRALSAFSPQAGADQGPGATGGPSVLAEATPSQPDQDPIRSFGQQITSSIQGMVQHLMGGGVATDQPVSPVPAPGGGYDPSSMTNPTLRTTPIGIMDVSPPPQPTVFDQVGAGISAATPAAQALAQKAISDIQNMGGATDRTNQQLVDTYPGLASLATAAAQLREGGAGGVVPALGTLNTPTGEPAANDLAFTDAMAGRGPWTPGAIEGAAKYGVLNVASIDMPPTGHLGQVAADVGAAGQGIRSALSQAEAAVSDLRARSPQMSEGSIAASGPGRALADLQAATPAAGSIGAPAAVVDVTDRLSDGQAPLSPALAATGLADQGASLTLRDLINSAKVRGYDTSALEAQLPPAALETPAVSRAAGGVGAPPAEPPAVTGAGQPVSGNPAPTPGEPVSPIDILKAVHSGNVISGLSTLTHVAVNSIIAPAWSLATQTGKDVAQTLASPITGQGAQFDRVAGRGIGVSAALARSGDAFASAIKDFYASPTNIANRVDIPILAGALKAQQATGAALHAAFQNVAQQAITHMELGAQAGEVASSEGLHGPAFVKRVSDLINDPGLGLSQQAIAKADDIGTRGALRGEAGAIQSVMQTVANVPVFGNALFPVVKIASQAFAQGIEKSPIGLVGTGFDVARGLVGTGPYAGGFNKLGGAVTPLGDRLTNNIAGTALTAFLASKALDGSITGNGPSDPDERKMLVSKGWEAHSVFVPTLGYVDYHLLGPLAVPFSIAGNFADATNYPQKQVDPNTGLKTTAPATADQVAMDMADRTLSYLGDSTGLRTLGDLYTVIHGGPGAKPVIAQFGGSLVGGFVPESGLVASLTKAADPEGARKPVSGDIGQVIGQNLPGLRQNVPLSRDVLGRVLPNEQAGLGAFMAKRGSSPDVISATTGGSGGPVINEVMRLRQAGEKVGITPPSVSGAGGYLGVAQTADQQALILRTVGNAVNLYALNTMANPAYATLTDTQKANALSLAINQAHRAANIDMSGNIARDPHNAALLQWAQTPQYAGVKGTPGEIARLNFQIAEAKAKLAAYKKALGTKGEMRMRLDDPAAFKLAQRDRVDVEKLVKLKAAIDAATGGALFRRADLASAGGVMNVDPQSLDNPA